MSCDVSGKSVVIYDDMIRTGGSIVGAAKAYVDAGASRITVVATHGVFPADAFQRIMSCGLIERNRYNRQSSAGKRARRSRARSDPDCADHRRANEYGTVVMKHIRIQAAALNQTPLDWVGNADRIKRALHC